MFRAGDHLRIELSGKVSDNPVQPREEEVKADGTINVEFLGAIDVSGKTPREVEQIIQTNYVPAYYRNATVTVTPLEMVYYVGGEVMHPGSLRYSGRVTVTKAVQAAGGFTDYASTSKIQLTRANGELVFVNYDTAQGNPALDPEVFPHDQITVGRRL